MTLARDAYGSVAIGRDVVTIRGSIHPGNSGGPAVDAAGRVRAVVYAQRIDKSGGYGVPVSFVRAHWPRSKPPPDGPVDRNATSCVDSPLRCRARYSRIPSAASGLAERRHDVDAGGEARGTVRVQLARDPHPLVRRARARPLECTLHVSRDEDAGHLVVHAQRKLVAPQRPEADEQRDRRRPAEPLQEPVEVVEVEEHLRHRETGSGLELGVEALQLELEVVRRRVHGDAEKNEVGASIERPLTSSPRFSCETRRVSPIESTW